MNFKAAVLETPDITNCYQPGLKALGANSAKISPGNTTLCNGSVNVDSCTAALYPNANRWDYCLGYNKEVYFVEVHPADSSDVSTIIDKLNWLKNWLKSDAPKLNQIKAATPFYWIMTGRYAILPGSNQEKKMAQSGIKLVSRLHLK